MKKMDEWLKLNTNPDNADFRFEMGLSYTQFTLDEKISLSNNDIEFKKEDIDKTHYEVGTKIYLNDLVSASLGIPTLNIDIGLAGFYREMRVKEYAYGGLLRFFGNDLQHTTLDFGFYLNHEDILIPAPINPIGTEDLKGEIKNWLFQGNLQIYLLDFIGLEGTYNYYAKANSVTTPKIELEGKGYTYSAFLELWLLRISGGFFHEEKTYTVSSREIVQEKDGVFFKGALYF